MAIQVRVQVKKISCINEKKKNYLKNYLNYKQSPNLSVIVNGWTIPKMYTRKYSK